MHFTLDEMEREGCVLLRCISGSRAYGTDLPTSDTDIRGVFILPRRRFYGLDEVPQLGDGSGNVSYFEVGRFIGLLLRNNPTALELLATGGESVLYRSPLLAGLQPERFLSRLCRDTFAGYARSQIQKARGLNKKIVRPMPEQRGSVVDFCYVAEEQGAVDLHSWLAGRGWSLARCGLARVPHMVGVYGLYYDTTGTLGYRGVVGDEHTSNDVLLSSIPKAEVPVGWLSFNSSAYSRYCRDHAEYWTWVHNRNAERYESTMRHGKEYDAKNMMHMFRMLDTAEEIARDGVLRVRRPDVSFLMRVRAGEFEYESLLEMAEERLERIAVLFSSSSLPEAPDAVRAIEWLVELREQVYHHGVPR